MAIANQTSEKLVRPLEGSLIRRYTVGTAVSSGDVVSMQADGFVDAADSTSAAVVCAGVCLQDAIVGEVVDVVTSGPVTAVTGATPGAIVHASDSAGVIAESAGSNAGILGWVESATTIFVNPQF